MDEMDAKPAAEDEADVLFEQTGAVGIATLNRPKALNALNIGMVRLLDARLRAWAEDASVKSVVIRGAGGKAFCAGGDIRILYDMGKRGEFDEACVFWREEYRLDRLIKRYPKPYLALLDGIVMGGGVGLSVHGRYRVASEKYLFAMPEVGIGFFPDVGATYVLPRLPGFAGEYLALTGARIKAGDALALGLATHGVPASHFDDVIAALANDEDIDRTLRKFMAPTMNITLDNERSIIHVAFSQRTVLAILEKLDALAVTGSKFAEESARTMRSKSPTSMCIALEQMKRGRDLDFESAMALEYRIVSRIGAGRDFYEGVRAVIVDKDQSPQWSPAKLEEVRQGDIDAYFAPLGDDELSFDADV